MKVAGSIIFHRKSSSKECTAFIVLHNLNIMFDKLIRCFVPKRLFLSKGVFRSILQARYFLFAGDVTPVHGQHTIITETLLVGAFSLNLQ